MDAQLQARLALETDLRKALANDEFFLVYQPILNTRNRTVSGFEALVRWNHPLHVAAAAEPVHSACAKRSG